MELTSTAFYDGGEIPPRYTCDGRDLSPPLTWNGAPAGTRSFVLIVDDPDAPDPRAPKMTWVHWVLYNLPASLTSLAEGAAPPVGAQAGSNDWQRAEYGGPCPPNGRHRYFFKLYALDTLLPAMGPASKAQVERAMAGHVLAEARLMGTYQRRR